MKVFLMCLCLIALLASLSLADDLTPGTVSKAIDRANMDTTVDPCDNFWLFANGNWLKTTTIPAEYSSWSVSHEMFERNNNILRAILEEAAADGTAKPGSPRQKIGDFYRVAMDTVKIEADRAKPLEADFAYINGLNTSQDVQNAIIKYHNQGIRFAFDLSSEQDLKNPEQTIAYISQGGLGLPDRDYYTRQDPESQKLREQYVQHVANMLKLLGDDPTVAQTEAAHILAMETRLANVSLTNVELRDPKVWYNIKTVVEADQITPNFSWDGYLKGLSLPQVQSFSMFPDKFFTEFNTMLNDVPIDDWKAYMRWHIIHGLAPYLSSDFINENFSFYSTTLQGVKQLRPRWKRVLQHTEGALGEVLGQVYVEKTFPPRAKQRAVELVQNLLASMKDRITEIDWMSDSTKQMALKKLASFTPKIGYPDKWRDYSALEISADIPYVQDVMRGRTFEFRRQMNKIGKPVDKTEWGMTPQTINAYYNPLNNEIVFPAAILQPPSFDPDADDASNYGAIGSVIGHEITHGFDDMGSQFAADGSLQNWWTDSDHQKFEERTTKLANQYSGYVVVDSMTINGKLTLGENIADLGGVKVSYYALQKALEGRPHEKIDGFTPEQRFFIAYAANWRTLQRPEALKLQVNTDPHSPAEYRVLGPLADTPEFQKAFGCSADAKMLRKPEDQVKIW